MVMKRLTNLERRHDAIVAAGIAVCILASAAARAATATASIIFDFPTNGAGRTPKGGVTSDPQGRLYGTTFAGGAFNYGTVWRLTPPQIPGGLWTEEILHSFTQTGEGGLEPNTSLAIGSDGSVYGTTQFGGATNRGVAYKLANQPGWPITVLHNFTKGTGNLPNSGLVFGPYGLLYGSAAGGYGNSGADYSLSPLGDTVEYNTINIIAQSGVPDGGVTAVPGKSLLIGVTSAQSPVPAAFYTVSVNNTGHGQATTQYSFGPPPDVDAAAGAPILGSGASAGAAFGCAFVGGANLQGGIYRVGKTASGAAAESVIFSFPDSQYPYARPENGCALAQSASGGALYAVVGGNQSGDVDPFNAFLQLTPPAIPGGAWTEQALLYFFTDNPERPAGPSYPMARIGNKYYVAMAGIQTGSQNGAIVEITVTP